MKYTFPLGKEVYEIDKENIKANAEVLYLQVKTLFYKALYWIFHY